MSVPYRYQEVKALCEQHPEAFPQGEQNDPARLTFLRTVIIPELNKLDGGNFGLLTKTEQGNKVPCDILCWKPTRQLVDCMTGTGATWNVMAPGPDTWEWTAVGDAPPPVQPPVTPPASTARAIFLAPITLPLAVGTAVDQPDGSVVVVNADDATVVSVQPDGSVEARPRDAIGAWERAKWAGPTVLCYGGTGKDFYVMCQPRG